MKKLLLLLVFSASLFACKKEEQDPTLEGKWTLDNIIVKEYVNSSLVSTDTEAGAGETIEFQANGTVILTEPGMGSLSRTYTLSGDQLTFDGETYTVQNLGHTNVTLYIRDTYGPGEYDDVYINLKR